MIGLVLLLLLSTPTIWFSLDHKRNASDGVVSGVGRKWKRSDSSDSDSGIGTLFSLDHKLYASDYDSDSDSVASENQPLRLDETHRFHKARVYCANSYIDMGSRCTTCWGERSIRF